MPRVFLAVLPAGITNSDLPSYSVLFSARGHKTIPHSNFSLFPARVTKKSPIHVFLTCFPFIDIGITILCFDDSFFMVLDFSIYENPVASSIVPEKTRKLTKNSQSVM